MTVETGRDVEQRTSTRSAILELGIMALILVGLVALMRLPDFNPGSGRGGWVGFVFVGSWVVGCSSG